MIINSTNIQDFKGLKGKEHLKEKETTDVFIGKDEFTHSSIEEKPDFMKLKELLSSLYAKEPDFEYTHKFLSGTSMAEPVFLPVGFTTRRVLKECEDGGYAEVVEIGKWVKIPEVL